jgi:hypothetical protein
LPLLIFEPTIGKNETYVIDFSCGYGQQVWGG